MAYTGRRFHQWPVGKGCWTHKNPAAYNRSRYNTLDDHCQMRQYWCTSPSNILLRQGCVRQLQSIHERWSLQQNNKSPEVHSCQQNNIENWARCFDLLTSVTCYQRLRYNVTTLQNTQGTLVVNIADMLSLAELGQSSDVTNAFPTATKYALLLYGVKGRSCQSLNRNATTMHARVTNLRISLPTNRQCL